MTSRPKPKPDAGTLLSSVAAALTACERAGLKVHLRHGIAETREGYILPIKNTWVTRTRTWTEFSPKADSDDES